jgi:hypothetical protein
MRELDSICALHEFRKSAQVSGNTGDSAWAALQRVRKRLRGKELAWHYLDANGQNERRADERSAAVDTRISGHFASLLLSVGAGRFVSGEAKDI